MTNNDPEVVLAEVVKALGGESRPGQETMVRAVSDALNYRTHLMVQAGTGTGKSLGYLVPAAIWAQNHNTTVVISTATLALQTQLAKSDLPTLKKGMDAPPTYAILKGRTNYACLQRVRSGGTFDQGTLFGGTEILETTQGVSEPTKLGAEVLALREWAEAQLESDGLADRDDAPSHSPRAWAQVSVPVRECPGVVNCPFGEECFVEESRRRAAEVQLVITNHALLAIDAMHGNTVLPEHGAIVIDEAHELTNRVTTAAADELSPAGIDRVAKRVLAHLADDDFAMEVFGLSDLLREALDRTEPGRILKNDHEVLTACQQIRSVSRKVITALGDNRDDLTKLQASAAMKEVFDVASRIAELSERDVIWISESERFGRQLNVAPLSVSKLLRERVLDKKPCILTSATLTVGGDFTGIIRSVGLNLEDQLPDQADLSRSDVLADAGTDRIEAVDSEDQPLVSGYWKGIDVGSPFDYSSQGILYVAKHLARPGREGINEANLAEIAQLVWAAGGRTLGLFSSQRAAEAAAQHVRRELPSMSILCQGDAQLSELTRRFNDESEVSLFGTLSLWQGIDAPGETCRLVIIDKIPFPRPDDPLMQARQRAVEASGGNGFMAVAVHHAGLLLAQGAGRLIRRTSDKGVVAVLDPRLVTQRYGSYLRTSLPSFWPTTDLDVAVGALLRLRDSTEN